jgi:hypothetical protein
MNGKKPDCKSDDVDQISSKTDCLEGGAYPLLGRRLRAQQIPNGMGFAYPRVGTPERLPSGSCSLFDVQHYLDAFGRSQIDFVAWHFPRNKRG